MLCVADWFASSGARAGSQRPQGRLRELYVLRVTSEGRCAREGKRKDCLQGWSSNCSFYAPRDLSARRNLKLAMRWFQLGACGGGLEA